jgi:histidinol dehydrogenase
MKLRRIKASSSELSSFLEANYEDMKQYEGQVQEIAQRVREKGNQAIFEYNQKFDGALINEDNFMVNEAEFEAAYDLVDDEFIFALRAAIDNIEVFHARQLRNSWMEADERGCILGQVFRPLERVGIYVPGGTAAYPSSVLMNAIPAQVAGVQEIAMVSPPGAGWEDEPLYPGCRQRIGLAGSVQDGWSSSHICPGLGNRDH